MGVNIRSVFKVIFVNLAVFFILSTPVFLLLNLYYGNKDRSHLDTLYVRENNNLRFALRSNSATRYNGITYRTNSLGFRDQEFPFLKTKGTYRIICVGDSLTFGQGIELNNTYSKLLERKLKKGYNKRMQKIW